MSSELIVPARAEKVFSVKCDDNYAFVPMDFEPRRLPGTTGLYFSRVNPDVLGHIHLRVLNVTEKDVKIPTRSQIGKVTQPNEIIQRKVTSSVI